MPPTVFAPSLKLQRQRWLVILPFIGLSLVLGWMGYGRYIIAQLSYELPSLNFSWSLPSFQFADTSNSAQPATLIISKLNLQTPIQRDVPIDNQSLYDDALLHGVALAGSSAPLEASTGNSFIFGHSSRFALQSTPYDAVFALLPKLQIGDEMQVVSNGQTAQYHVTLSQVISATEVQYLNSSSKRELTLVTCWPIGTNLKRWVVQAVKNS